MRKVVSPEDEGGVGWEKMYLEETRGDTIIEMAFVGSAFAIFLIVGVVIMWSLMAALVAAVIFVGLMGGIFAYGYFKSLCPSCGRPWSHLTVARKVSQINDETRSVIETRKVTTYPPGDPHGTPTTASFPTGRIFHYFKRTAHVLYYKRCKYCGYGWNSKGKSAVGQISISRE